MIADFLSRPLLHPFLALDYLGVVVFAAAKVGAGPVELVARAAEIGNKRRQSRLLQL